MKKIIPLILLILMLAGCAKPAPAPTVPEPSQAPSTVPETQAPTEPEPEGLSYGEPGEIPGIYRIPLTEPGLLAEIVPFGDSLLLEYFRQSDGESDFLEPEKIVKMDIETGKIQASYDYTGAESANVQVCGDRIAVADWSAGTITFLNKNLEKTEEYTVNEGWCTSYVDETGTYAYVSTNDGALKKLNLSTGGYDYLLPDARNTYIETCYGDYLTVGYLNTDFDRYEHLGIRMSDGQILTMSADSSFSSAVCRGDIWMASKFGRLETYFFDKNGACWYISMPDTGLSFAEGPAVLMGSSYDDPDFQKLRFYQDDGKLLYACDYPMDKGYLQKCVWSEKADGYFFLSAGEGTKLLFWDPKPCETGETLEFSQEEEGLKPGTAVSPELYHRAEDISSQFGVSVAIADQCPKEYGKFLAEQVVDEKTIQSSLDTLESALYSYPDGFFYQLPYGYFSRVEIYLTGHLTDQNVPEDANGFTDFAAFVNDEGGLYMVLDISRPDLERTIYHEFSHIIDKKLEFHARNHPSMYSEDAWASFNPEDFSYAESVYELPDSIYGDDYDRYFVDIYSRTFPTEDRARIMENAMIGDGDFFGYEYYAPLRDKLVFYSEAIRECFNTAFWPEVTRWEEPLYY